MNPRSILKSNKRKNYVRYKGDNPPKRLPRKKYSAPPPKTTPNKYSDSSAPGSDTPRTPSKPDTQPEPTPKKTGGGSDFGRSLKEELKSKYSGGTDIKTIGRSLKEELKSKYGGGGGGNITIKKPDNFKIPESLGGGKPGKMLSAREQAILQAKGQKIAREMAREKRQKQKEAKLRLKKEPTFHEHGAGGPITEKMVKKKRQKLLKILSNYKD